MRSFEFALAMRAVGRHASPGETRGKRGLAKLLLLSAGLACVPVAAWAQVPSRPPIQVRLPAPRTAAIEPGHAASAPATSSALIAAVTLADIGFVDGFRFANLGGRRELFVPLPQNADVAASALVLVLDDISAHDARRNLEVLVNDRTVTAIVLDGKTRGRVVRIPLSRTNAKDGYLKLAFQYSGAATLDRCIDVRYVGDSLTIRAETAIEVDVGASGSLDVATNGGGAHAARCRDRHAWPEVEGGRDRQCADRGAIADHVGPACLLPSRLCEAVADLAKPGDANHWTQGVVLVGTLPEAMGMLDSPLAKVAGALPAFGTLAAVRIGGTPALLVSDGDAVRAARLLASPSLAATRGIESASVGEIVPAAQRTDRASFDQLGVAPAQADVFGRADLTAVIDIRRLPAGRRASRLLLDVMVAPDGAGEKAVVSAFVNEHLLGSTVAAIGDATHLDLPLPDGLVGMNANVRVLVQRDSAQGDCRFEPQGYPAQILGSSALLLTSVDGNAHDFSDLASRWANGIELLVPTAVADQPAHTLGMVAQVLNQLSPDIAPISVNLVASGSAPAPDAPFLAVSDSPPRGTSPRVRFDRGRVMVADRGGRTLLDLGGFVSGAVAQVVTADSQPGLWIKPLSADEMSPSPPELRLDHGDVAFIDPTGVALAMSTERDTVIKISYPDQVSWLTVAERFRSWIIVGLWLIATASLLYGLQRMFRRRPAAAGD